LTEFRKLSPRERSFFVVSWLLAAPMSAALSLAGFRRTTALLAKVPSLAFGVRSGDDRRQVKVERAEELVQRAFRWSPARWSAADGGCLPRSMVQYAVHRLSGSDVRLVVGVRREADSASRDPGAPPGLDAHAWIEDRARPRSDVSHAVIFAMPGAAAPRP
jgi:hypothetical protein